MGVKSTISVAKSALSTLNVRLTFVSSVNDKQTIKHSKNAIV